MGAFRSQFWQYVSLHFCVDFGGRQKVTRAAPRAAGTEPARPLENIFQERRIVKVFCISNTPLVPVGTVADLKADASAAGPLAKCRAAFFSVGSLAAVG